MNKIAKKSILICAVITSASLVSCGNTPNKAANMANHRHDSSKAVFACTMHPGITGKTPGKCSKCGMDLVAIPADSVPEVKVNLSTFPQTPEAGSSAKLTFTFKTNNRNLALDISHEMKVHLMIADENLAWFRHIHPKEQADGSYVVSETFPNGGKYFLFTNFKTPGAAPAVNKKEIIVKGNSGNSHTDFSDNYISLADGYTVMLKNGGDFKTNRAQPIEISVEKDGRQLTGSDIEPYLGATAHIAMIGNADKSFLHIHTRSGSPFPIYAETNIHKPGIYRIWVEFQTNGKVHTAAFTVSVLQGGKESNRESPDAHQH
jgi:heavy metal-binding protein